MNERIIYFSICPNCEEMFVLSEGQQKKRHFKRVKNIFCSSECKNIKQKKQKPWNKRSEKECKKINGVIEKTRSLKKAAKILGMTLAAVGTFNNRHCKINCRVGWAKDYPKWTKEEDEFAIECLKKNPDLRCLMKEIEKKRNVIYSEKFLYHIRNRSASVWKLNLKKIRANKKLNKTMFKDGLEPWNKHKTKENNLIMKQISMGNTGKKHSLETLGKITKINRAHWADDKWLENWFKSILFEKDHILTDLDKEIIRTRVRLFKIQHKEVKNAEIRTGGN